MKAWFGRQGKAASTKANPWSPWLTRFRTPKAPPPKRLADFQYYMQHTDFKAKVVSLVDARRAGVNAKELLKLRSVVARELLAGESDTTRARIKGEADSEHAVLMAKEENAMEGLPALDEEGREE